MTTKMSAASITNKIKTLYTGKHKYWAWGGTALAAYFLIHGQSSADVKPAMIATPPPLPPPTPAQIAAQAPFPFPSTSSQYSPVYEPPPYIPPYYPPRPYYPPPQTYYPPPQTYYPPQQYVPPVVSYPGVTPVTIPAESIAAYCQTVIGMTTPQARIQLSAKGIYPHVRTVNGRPIATATVQIPSGVPVADLAVSSNRVVSANCYTSA